MDLAPWTSVTDATAYGRALLVGDRVRLRALHEEDLPQLDRWWQDEELMALQADAVRPRPPGSQTETFRRWSVNDSSTAVGFSVVARDGGELVGHVTMWGADVRTRCATLAIIVGSEHTGQGYGTGAVRVALRYAFQEMGLHRVQLQVWAANDRALATYARAGFREEGRRREVSFHAGRWHDEVLMAVLEHEWRDLATDP
ncbi:GNAT family N-acetyltransferase [Kineococcus siccus]|uniref:GNAT family N-acetyltransferase n=1 Tax=Kineococcus siccus TaxID=2696567 RepID=UPI00196ADE38